MKSSPILTLALGAFVFGSCVMPAEDAALWPDVVETISPGRLQRVMDYGVDLEAYSEWGLTALEVAVWNGRPLEIVQDLLDAGADVEVRGVNEAGLLQGAVEGYRRASAEPIDLLLRYGCALKAQDSYGNTAWWMALDRGDVSALRVLDTWGGSNENRATVARKYFSGRYIKLDSAIYLFAEMKRADPVGWAQKVPLDLFIVDDGRYAFFLDGTKSFMPPPATNIKLLHQLFESGFPVDFVDRKGNNLLHYACMKNGSHSGTIPFLLKHAADPNFANADGDRPLHLLVQRGYFGCRWQDDFDALIAAGADFYALNDAGKNPLSLAKDQKEPNLKILSSLQSFAAKRSVKE